MNLVLHQHVNRQKSLIYGWNEVLLGHKIILFAEKMLRAEYHLLKQNKEDLEWQR